MYNIWSGVGTKITLSRFDQKNQNRLSVRAFAVGDNAAGFSAQTGQSLAQFRTDFPAFEGVFSRKKRPIAAHPAAQLAAHPCAARLVFQRMAESEVTQRKKAGDEPVVVELVEGLLTKTILREGSGPNPPADGTQKMVMHYTGKLTDGTVFDSSVSRGTPFEFTLGAREVILGWDKGVATMKKGEKAILTCAPEYAYGDMGAGGVIPPKATLQFEVEVRTFFCHCGWLDLPACLSARSSAPLTASC